jgi:hypothetical protein
MESALISNQKRALDFVSKELNIEQALSNFLSPNSDIHDLKINYWLETHLFLNNEAPFIPKITTIYPKSIHAMPPGLKLRPSHKHKIKTLLKRLKIVD